MNENEIRTMEAGRELDALVAEKVMGLMVQGEYILPITAHGTRVPYYSTDIAAAWKVVEKMNGGEWWCDLSWRDDVCYGRIVWAVDFVKKDGRCESADDESAPLAICRAALLAVTGPR